MRGAGREIGKALACGQAAGLACAMVLGPAALADSLPLAQLGPALFWALVYGLLCASTESLEPASRLLLGAFVGASAAAVQVFVFGPAFRLAGTPAAAPGAFLVFGCCLGLFDAASSPSSRGTPRATLPLLLPESLAA